MKKADNYKIWILRGFAIPAALLMGLTACAPPPSSDAGLKQEVRLLKQQQKEQQQTVLFLQQQLTQLQQQLQIPSAVAEMGQGTLAEPVTPEPRPSPLPLPGSEEVETLVAAASSYLEAFSALAMGNYQQAQNDFNRFISEYSEHRYAPNARYWLAETEIALGQTGQAEENLLMVANNQLNDDKIPAALLRLAQLYKQQNLTDQAEDILHQLRTRFPESREAQQL